MNYYHLKMIADAITEKAAKMWRVDFEDIIRKSRYAEFTDPRHAVIFVLVTKYSTRCHRNTAYMPSGKISLKMIGKYFSDRGHSTILHSKAKAEDLMFTEPDYQKMITILGELADEVYNRILTEEVQNVA